MGISTFDPIGELNESSWARSMVSASNVTISIDDLVVGSTCSNPIEGEGGVLLVGARSRITHQVISGLRDRGIHSIAVHPNDATLLRGGSRRRKKKSIPAILRYVPIV